MKEKSKFTITIPIKWRPEVKRSLFERIFKKKPPQLSAQETFTISPCVCANQQRIAIAAMTLPNEVFVGGMPETVLPIIADHNGTIVYIIAAGIQNNHEEPSADLITFIERNFDNEDLFTFLFPVIESLYMQEFLNSIVLMRGTSNILKPKPAPTEIA